MKKLLYILTLISFFIVSCGQNTSDTLVGDWTSKRKKNTFNGTPTNNPIAFLSIESKGKSILIEYDWRGYKSNVKELSGIPISDLNFKTSEGDLTYNKDVDVIYFKGEEFTRDK